MIRPRNEHTLAGVCEVRGKGYWSGREVRVRFCPAAASSGIRFVRTDLPGHPSCLAISCNVTPGSLRTNLRDGDASFEMIEHVMAALYGLEVDNCIVEIDAEEIPGMDGSAKEFVHALRSVGMVVQAAARKRYLINRNFRVGDDHAWIEAMPVSDGHPVYEYWLDYGDHSPIRPQSYCGSLSAHSFARELAPARTFVTAEQVDRLRSAGVGTHVGPQDLLVFDDSGLIDNRLRYENECARHKALDLIGDLALTGFDLVGHFVSNRGGHRLNAELATQLAEVAQVNGWLSVTPDGFEPSVVECMRVTDPRQDVSKVPWGRVA